jgi:polyadenylate-binding protein
MIPGMMPVMPQMFARPPMFGARGMMPRPGPGGFQGYHPMMMPRGAPRPPTNMMQQQQQDGQHQQPTQQQQQPPAMMPLTAGTLASASPEVRKNLLGERLYPLVAASEPALAGKVTGMLLDGMETGELLHLIESPEMLQLKIREAIEVLESASEE